MRLFAIPFLFLFHTVVYGQVLDLHPSIKASLDFNQTSITKFNTPEALEACDKVYEQMDADGRSWDELTAGELWILNNCDETKGSIWETIGGGCSWYCGMGPKEVSASSSLDSQGKNTYGASNAHDFSYMSAWVEGVPGYGIGEYLIYTFAPDNPRIDKIKVANGYVKSASAWTNNSRVKKLNMYVNDELFAYLNLKDIRAEQHFSIPPIGNGDRSDYEALKQKDNWTIKFEIAEVYEGAKYDDVVISEIYFDGLDVHCFAAGTKVTMADGSAMDIEHLKVGDEVLSFNTLTGVMEPSRIIETAEELHCNLAQITFNNGQQVQVTRDHPFYNGEKWMSLNPHKTMGNYQFNDVKMMRIGDLIQSVEGLTEIISVESMPQPIKTYTIVKLDKNNAFIANGLVVGTEEIRSPEKLTQKSTD